MQANPDDFKARVPEYVVENLGIETFELKWRQTKKNIGGELKMPALGNALHVKGKDCVTIFPDPIMQVSQSMSEMGGLSVFEQPGNAGSY